MTNDEGPARRTDQEAKGSAQLQPAAVQERVEQIVTHYVQCARIDPTEEELAVIREKAKVWEIWDRLRRAYSGERF